MKTITTTYDPTTNLLTTTYKGPLTAEDAKTWESQLTEATEKIPANTDFKLLLDIHSFEPINIDAHKAMRNIIPMLLANHGLRPAFIDLFDEKPELPIKIENGKRCVAFANVHHEENKMADYQRRIGKPNQHFFTDYEKAKAWILSL
ncbi:hypothetical protein [Bdellovibrio sp. HCB2-146]|uniref:hypothetical protein n=1 Tax=Bdellovibrio sp. HCB2-146 TaxID=3394362 RepID=UPI0039BCDAC4